jgi:centromere/kinetochore protein ZW10
LGADSTDRTIKTLFTDLEAAIQFLNQKLPREIVEPLSRRMMPMLTSRILEDWLDTAVPASLNDMVSYQKALAQVGDFAAKLDSIKWPGGDSLHDWVSNAPKIWLNKRRETALDWTRNQLSLGIGEPQMAERTETRMVARDEGPDIATAGPVVNDEWDAAWDGDEPEPVDPAKPESNGHPRNRSSLDEERRLSEISTPSPEILQDMDDATDAWGFDDDEAVEEETATSTAQTEQNDRPPLETRNSPETREVTLSEKYWTSSLPQPVFNTVVQIYNDGAQLTKPEYIPNTPNANHFSTNNYPEASKSP